MSDEPVKTQTLRHTVRGLELDASGAMSLGWIARHLEHCRWEMFRAQASPLATKPTSVVVRASVFEYVEPIRFPDSLEILTWLARVGRTSLDLGHRITRTLDGVTLARARATLVHVGPKGPAPLDPGLRDLTCGYSAPDARQWQESERRSMWARDWIATPSDEDSFKHVNQARYVDYIDDTRQLATLANAPAGAPGPLASLAVEYIRETRAGDRVQMQTWITGEQARAFELTRRDSEELLCRGQIQCALTTSS